jgi:osmotically-inducible protein OsmY|tara:strand:+ start:577 stop:1173 length:597 start_codon:yes stop_codon:yes gene_type:complete
MIRFRSLAASLLLLASLSGCTPAGVVVGAAATGGILASQERGLTASLSDNAIRFSVNEKWFRRDLTLYQDVELQVLEGRVLLTGQVRDVETRILAVNLAWQTDGVKEVINEIQVHPVKELLDRGRDSLIYRQLTATLLLDSAVQSINYSLNVVGQTVYFLGIAQDQRELDRVIAHAKNQNYVRRVVSYVRLKRPAREG